MNLTPDVQAALEHAKFVLAEERAAVSGGEWFEHQRRLELRHALQDLTAAVEAAEAARGNQP